MALDWKHLNLPHSEYCYYTNTSMRVKGKIVGHLKRIDKNKSSLMIEIEFPTVIDVWHPYESRESGYSRFWYVPPEIVVYFHDKHGKDFIDRLTRKQLEAILVQAVTDGKLKDTVLYRYQGGVNKFSKKELDAIRQYVGPETKLLATKKARMIRSIK